LILKEFAVWAEVDSVAGVEPGDGPVWRAWRGWGGRGGVDGRGRGRSQGSGLGCGNGRGRVGG
jgi:hypothetical protein